MRFNLLLIVVAGWCLSGARANAQANVQKDIETGAITPLLGTGVGNADLLVAEGARLYNEKTFEQSKEHFLKATRVAPQNLPTYLSLARAYFALNEYERACYAYRVYVKSSQESPDRGKAQSELDLCERRLGAGRDFAEKYVIMKARFYELLDQRKWMGDESASTVLREIIAAGYASPEVGEMASKLVQRVESSADSVYQAVANHQRKSVEELRSASDLYRLAILFGTLVSHQDARAAFLEGMADLGENNHAKAIALFKLASQKEPAAVEPRFYFALAKFVSGERTQALQHLEAELPKDPRTAILKVAAAQQEKSSQAASELENLLFTQRFPANP
jgi:tetratricopeptide (TPR) repeat protein